MQVLDVYGLFDYVDGDDKTEYTSAEISDFLHPLMGDGVCVSDGGEFFATAEGLIVTLADGRAFLAGRGGKNTAAKTILRSCKERRRPIQIRRKWHKRTIYTICRYGRLW